MLKLIFTRIFTIVPVMFAIVTLIFFVTRIIPADPVLALSGEFATEKQIHAMKERWGLDKPIYQQYGIYIRQLVRGDLGVSFHSHRPVIQDLAYYLPGSIELVIVSIIIAYPLGIIFGAISAVRKDRSLDFLIRVVSLLGASAPIFWFAVLLQVSFYKLGLLPISGRIDINIQPPMYISGLYILDSLLSGNWVALKSSINHAVLPVSTVVFFQMAISTRMTRAGMIEILGKDFVRTARSKGLPEYLVVYKHALKNSLISLITVWGVESAKLIATCVVVEVVFGWPGIGKYLLDSVVFMDFPAITGSTIALSAFFLLFGLLSDLLYITVDPRIKYY